MQLGIPALSMVLIEPSETVTYLTDTSMVAQYIARCLTSYRCLWRGLLSI